MAEFDPNEEQKQFIKAFGSNVLVSASAGAGKTSTMIQKLVTILKTTKIPVSSLLVVTYTNAAASEIKHKLYNEISKSINNTDDEKERLYLVNQLDNINNAEIGTLHAICKKLLVKYFYELDLSPDFVLLSEQEKKYLLDSAIDSVFKDKINKNDDKFYALYECYNAKRNDETLKKIVTDLIDYSNAIINYSEWSKNTLEHNYTDDLDNNEACKYVMQYYKNRVGYYKKEYERLLDYAQRVQIDRFNEYLYNRKVFIDEFAESKSFTQSNKILFGYQFSKKPNCGKNDSVDITELNDRIVEVSDDFNKLIKDIKEQYVSDDVDIIKQNINNAKNNLITIYDLVDHVKQTYKEYKLKRNCLDFNDLEDKMINLLDGGICDLLKNKYQYIFVDEYQDINDKQEYILSKLVSGDNYYMIGDVKQSIYAFRQSSPKIFISKFNSFQSNKDNGSVINFNKNYRSERNILEFVNSIFARLITKQTIGIDYTANAMFESDRQLVGGKVRLNIINKDSNDEVENDGEELENDKKEAIVIAQQIVDICKEKSPSGENYKYSDIAIIMRNGGHFLSVLSKTLTAMQIPIKASIKNEFLDSLESQILVSILKVVSNYKDEISLCIVLKNLFNVTDEELAEISMYNKDTSFSDNIEMVKNDNSMSNAINIKIQDFFNFWNDSQTLLTHMTISDYLYWVLDKYNLLLKIKSWGNSIERENNALQFIKLTQNEDFQYNIDKFLNYLDFVSRNDEPQIIGGGANCVTLCTIHYSKGLEFPVVILAGMGKKFQLNKDTSDVVRNNRFGFGVKNIDSENRTLQDTIVRCACKIDNRKSEFDEEIRLLYVAMTRPKNILVMVGSYHLEKTVQLSQLDVYDANSFIELILGSMGKNLDKFNGNNSDFVLNKGLSDECIVNIIDGNSIVDDSINHSSVVLSEPNSQLLQSLQGVFDKAPSLETHTIKNTVTNILREEIDYENLISKPKVFTIADGVDNTDALSLGTAYHTIMQNLDFSENEAKILDIIKDMVDKNIVGDNISKLINVNQILKAIQVIRPLIVSAKNVYREKQFLLREKYSDIIKNSSNNDFVIIQGVIDLAIVGDEVVLIDYKTNKTKSERFLIDEYRLQLEIYKIAFEKATNLKVDHIFIYSFEMGKLIEIN